MKSYTVTKAGKITDNSGTELPKSLHEILFSTVFIEEGVTYKTLMQMVKNDSIMISRLYGDYRVNDMIVSFFCGKKPSKKRLDLDPKPWDWALEECDDYVSLFFGKTLERMFSAIESCL